MIRVFQADDHAIVRDGMRWLLMGEDDIELVGEAAEGRTAVQKIAELKPDIVLLDLQMPIMNGFEAIPLIQQASPASKIIVITSFNDNEHVFQAIQSGAVGYLLKDTMPQKILQVIRNAAEGNVTLDASIAQRVLDYVTKLGKPDKAFVKNTLTQREIEILKWVAKGETNLEIAQKLFVSERTVRTHVSNILGKLHLANRTQAALYALREGIASLDD